MVGISFYFKHYPFSPQSQSTKKYLSSSIQSEQTLKEAVSFIQEPEFEFYILLTDEKPTLSSTPAEAGPTTT